MRCKVIVLINLSTNDSREELEENRKSLKKKYEARGQECIEVDYPSGVIENLRGRGSVGVYVLSHTKDVVPSTLAGQLFAQLFKAGADVRKISIACCKASAHEGPMKPFCTELAKLQNKDCPLPTGLMVCGFNINVTTFDSKSPFMDKEGAKFKNYAEIKEDATRRHREVATVKQAWAPVGSGGTNYMYFVHERMGSGQTPVFVSEAVKLFEQQLEEQWALDRKGYIEKFNGSQKKNKQIDDPQYWTWGDFEGTHPDWAGRYVKSVFWPKFIRCIKEVSGRSAAMWCSLDGYMKMKTVMQFDGKTFQPTALSEYAENQEMKQALRWVEQVDKSSGINLQFLPAF